MNFSNWIVWFISWWGWPFVVFIMLLISQFTFVYRYAINKVYKSRFYKKYGDLALRYYEQNKELNKVKKELAEMKGEVYNKNDGINYDRLLEDVLAEEKQIREKKE